MTANNSDNLANEIREINLSYLLLVQRILRDDFSSGLFRTGLSEDAGRVLVDLTSSQLLALASSTTLLAGFRLADSALLSILNENTRMGILQQARSAIAMAQSQPMQEQITESTQEIF